MTILSQQDPELWTAIQYEQRRQQSHLEFIASENYASPAVKEAECSVFRNKKYAEGYPGHRYYEGCDGTDMMEILAINRAKYLYSAEHANVQPHSGAQANMAAYMALLKPGDVVMGMSLAHGGHLTHGSPVNSSGQLYSFVSYGVNRKTELLDYAEVERLAQQHRPKLIVAGASSYPRIIHWHLLRQTADLVGARLMVDIAHIAGLIAAGLHPSPTPQADVVTSTTHKTLRGPRGGFILCRAALAAAIDHSVFPGVQSGAALHTMAAKAVAFREAAQPRFKAYQQKVLENASVLAQELQTLGCRIVTGGTETHMVLVDLTSFGVSGRQAAQTLDEVGITVNRNTIPFDPRPPQVASGIRLGTPAVTTRGLEPEHMRQIAHLTVKVLLNPGNNAVLAQVRREVEEICEHFPVPSTPHGN